MAAKSVKGESPVGRSASRFRIIEVKMWGDEDFSSLSKPAPSAQFLWLYLMTCPESGPIPGLFRAGQAQLAETLGWTVPEFQKCWAEIEAQGMAKADWNARVVWLPNGSRNGSRNGFQNPNQVGSCGGYWDELPTCELVEEARLFMREQLTHRNSPEFVKTFDRTFTCKKPRRLPEPLPQPLLERFPEGLGESLITDHRALITERRLSKEEEEIKSVCIQQRDASEKTPPPPGKTGGPTEAEALAWSVLEARRVGGWSRVSRSGPRPEPSLRALAKLRQALEAHGGDVVSLAESYDSWSETCYKFASKLVPPGAPEVFLDSSQYPLVMHPPPELS